MICRRPNPTAEAFAAEFGVREGKWSERNVSRLLRLSGERPERLLDMREILGCLGMGFNPWPAKGGVFDHGMLFVRGRQSPWAVVGHPYSYGFGPVELELLATLARLFPALKVSIDDRPSLYGHGTHHIRIELTERRQPFGRIPATAKTREVLKEFRKTMSE